MFWRIKSVLWDKQRQTGIVHMQYNCSWGLNKKKAQGPHDQGHFLIQLQVLDRLQVVFVCLLLLHDTSIGILLLLPHQHGIHSLILLPPSYSGDQRTPNPKFTMQTNKQAINLIHLLVWSYLIWSYLICTPQIAVIDFIYIHRTSKHWIYTSPYKNLRIPFLT